MNQDLTTRLDQLAARVHSPQGALADKKALYAQLRQRLNLSEARIEPVHRPFIQRFGRWGIAASLLLVVSLGIAGVAVYRWSVEEPSAETQTELASPETPAVPLLFRQVPLADITQQLSRFYGVRIRLASPELEQYRVTATFAADEPLADIIDALSSVAQCKWRKTADGYELFIDASAPENH